MADEQMETDGSEKVNVGGSEAPEAPTYLFQSTTCDPNFDREDEESGDDDELDDDDDDEMGSDYSDDSSFLSDASDSQGGTLLDAISSYTAKTPRQKFKEFLDKISTGKTKVFKITDDCVLDYNLMAGTVGTVAVAASESVSAAEQAQIQAYRQRQAEHQRAQLEEQGQLPPRAAQAVPLYQELVTAVTAAPGLTHAILGHGVLQLLGPAGQLALLQAVCAHDTLLFLKLGTDHSMRTGVLSTHAILQALTCHSTPCLAEMEFRGFALQTAMQVEQLVTVIGMRTNILRQLNLLGIEFPADTQSRLNRQGFLDPVLAALSRVEPLDELRCVGLSKPVPHSIVTSSALAGILLVKKKWWRLALDGMGLDDAHCRVIIDMFARDATCKAGDLLSLYDNPAITSESYKSMAALFFLKRRMGAIKVDDTQWEAKFDLVRSMNNLHSRMDYMDDGAMVSGHDNKWVQWLEKLNTVSWEDDKHKLNYLWFTLLEKPDLIYNRD
jgi:hypothetical protein